MFAGAVHVLSGPDHLAAIAPLASDSRRQHWKPARCGASAIRAACSIVGRSPCCSRTGCRSTRCRRGANGWSASRCVAIGVWGSDRALALARVDREPASARRRDARRTLTCIAPPAHARARSASASCTASRAVRTSSPCSPRSRCPICASSLGYLAGYGVGTVAAMTLFSIARSASSAARAEPQRSGRGALAARPPAPPFAMIVGVAWIAHGLTAGSTLAATASAG